VWSRSTVAAPGGLQRRLEEVGEQRAHGDGPAAGAVQLVDLARVPARAARAVDGRSSGAPRSAGRPAARRARPTRDEHHRPPERPLRRGGSTDGHGVGEHHDPPVCACPEPKPPPGSTGSWPGWLNPPVPAPPPTSRPRSPHRPRRGPPPEAVRGGADRAFLVLTAAALSAACAAAATASVPATLAATSPPVTAAIRSHSLLAPCSWRSPSRLGRISVTAARCAPYRRPLWLCCEPVTPRGVYPQVLPARSAGGSEPVALVEGAGSRGRRRSSRLPRAGSGVAAVVPAADAEAVLGTAADWGDTIRSAGTVGRSTRRRRPVHPHRSALCPPGYQLDAGDHPRGGRARR
jgi:hypothetical protein